MRNFSAHNLKQAARIILEEEVEADDIDYDAMREADRNKRASKPRFRDEWDN